MQLRTPIFLLSATVLSVLGIAAPSAAEEPPSLTATTPAQSRYFPGETHHDAAVRAALEHLSKTQTREEIQAVLDSGEPTESLADPGTFEVIAARLAEPAPRLFEIVPRGPGCATTDACATGAVSYG